MDDRRGWTRPLYATPISSQLTALVQDFLKVQIVRLPTRNEVWRTATLGGAVAAVTLIEKFSLSRSCL